MDTLTVYADYVCPFCYLGRASLAQYRESREEPLEIEWHPFDLRGQHRAPDGSVDLDAATPDGDYMRQVEQNVERLKSEYGADEMLSVTEVPDVDSLDAQAVSLHVQSEAPEKWAAFDDALYDALWIDGDPIDERGTLRDCAAAAGLDGEIVSDALDGGAREAVRERFEAAKNEGITGVPTFVAGEHAARGAIPPEQFERLLG